MNNIKQLEQLEQELHAEQKFASEPDMHEIELNKFADWSDQEYEALLGFKFDASKEQKNVAVLDFGDLPAEVNWAEAGKVTPVKNQGSCGSCWSFSATGAIESAHMIKGGEQVLLSEQQLVDCSLSYGNNGCGGGLVEYAFNYVKHKPLETEDEYPYQAKDSKCTQDVHPGDVQLSDFKDVQRFNPEQLAQALQLGPVSVGVNAATFGFKFYKSGVIKRACNGDSIDHAVLAVGYGTEKGTPYWLVKNSWGADWGEKGYFKVLRDMKATDGGMCGILYTPAYPIL